jgi:hypothetical protein
VPPYGLLVYRYLNEVRQAWPCTYEPGVNDQPVTPGCYTFHGSTTIDRMHDEDALRANPVPRPPL